MKYINLETNEETISWFGDNDVWYTRDIDLNLIEHTHGIIGNHAIFSFVVRDYKCTYCNKEMSILAKMRYLTLLPL